VISLEVLDSSLLLRFLVALLLVLGLAWESSEAALAVSACHFLFCGGAISVVVVVVVVVV
jgi:hypothetical protein